jgi:predicted  nucleic acid-binding Zn-ribbon protein
MKESLKRLIKLQEIDTQLMEIEEQKGDLPAVVERLTSDVDQLLESLTVKGSRSPEIETESRLLQGKLEETREQLKKYQEQLLLVSTNRAYDALMTEIDGAKSIIDEGEFHLLELHEESQRLGDEVKAEEMDVERKREELQVQQKLLESMIAATEAETKSLQQARKKLITNIEPKYLRAYERIRAAREGIAVTELSRGACGVCYNRVPPQQQAEIRAMDRIITCESCGVILFSENG